MNALIVLVAAGVFLLFRAGVNIARAIDRNTAMCHEAVLLLGAMNGKLEEIRQVQDRIFDTLQKDFWTHEVARELEEIKKQLKAAQPSP